MRRALCRSCGCEAVPNDHAGGQASKLYAPKQTIKETVAKFARALRRGPEALRTFFNTQLARTWKEGADAPEWQDVYSRRDDYLTGTVPSGALILFAGADVHPAQQRHQLLRHRMLKLAPRADEPFWLDLLPGVRVRVRPATPAAMIAARAEAGHPAPPAPAARGSLLAARVAVHV